jgi:G3E family GTPase
VRPFFVVLEATGLADPIAIGELLQASDLKERIYLANIWCIVDSINFIKMEKTMMRIRHQVRIADTVILNKTDSDKIDIPLLETLIKRLNPFASIKRTSYCAVEFSDIFSSSQVGPVALGVINENNVLESEGRPEIGAKVIRSTRQANEDEFTEILRHLAEKLYRIKGFVRFMNGNVTAVQCSFGTVELTPVENYEGPSELILMGPDLESNAELYRSIFN